MVSMPRMVMPPIYVSKFEVHFPPYTTLTLDNRRGSHNVRGGARRSYEPLDME